MCVREASESSVCVCESSESVCIYVRERASVVCVMGLEMRRTRKNKRPGATAIGVAVGLEIAAD